MNKMRKSILMMVLVLGIASTVTAATDVDGDGLYEDVNGDGVFNIQDVSTLFEMVSDGTDNENFDFNEDGTVDATDVQSLFVEGGFSEGDLTNSQDIDSDGYNEDIDGDGAVTAKDVSIFFDNYETAGEEYDFNGDGSIDISDVQNLYVEAGLKTSPQIGDEVPGDGSVIERDYDELTGDGTVDLEVNATDPAAGDVNVTFYNASDDEAIGSDDSYGPIYSVSWDVDTFDEHQWYAVAEDAEGNTTESGTYSFETQNTDSSPPTITFDSTPSGTVLDRSVTVEGTLDEEGKIEYRLDDGSYQTVSGGYRTDFQFDVDSLSNGDHTITVRSEDRAGNTNTNSFSFEVADGSEVSFQVNVDQSYPRSGIPIDPDSDIFSSDTDVDFDFTLESGGNNYDISNDYQDGVCDFRGDEGWNLGGDLYCGTEVPENIQLGDYNLVAEWELRGESHRRVLDSNFPISDTATWYSSSMSHGGRVEGAVNLNTNLESDYETYDGQKVTCTGNTYEVNNIQQVTARCSNGASSTSTPPVVTFVNRDGQKVSTANNDMFGDSNCEIGDGITRQQLFGVSGLDTDDQGYNPQNCNVQWTLGGDSSFEAHTFNQPGDYDVFVDYPNAISNSPDYICPARTDNNNLCNQGSIAGDETGWKNVKHESVKVVDTSASISDSSFAGNTYSTEVEGEDYLRRKGYDGSIQGAIEFENTGSGIIEVTNMDFSCPSGVDCTTVTDLSGGLEVESGEKVNIVWTADPDERTTGSIDVELQYDDIYGLGCSPQKSYSESYYLDEANPETGEEVN